MIAIHIVSIITKTHHSHVIIKSTFYTQHPQIYNFSASHFAASGLPPSPVVADAGEL